MVDYCECGFNVIFEDKFLSTKDKNNLEKLVDEITKCFDIDQSGRTITEMNYSVLNNTRFPTMAGKYFQCLREEIGQFKNLCDFSTHYKKSIADKELLEAELSEIDTTTKIGKAQAKVKEAEISGKELELSGQQNRSHSIIREIISWEELKNKILKKDSKFDITDCNAHQKESYAQRWKKESNVHSKENLATLEKAEL